MHDGIMMHDQCAIHSGWYYLISAYIFCVPGLALPRPGRGISDDNHVAKLDEEWGVCSYTGS